jgi:hypothetical protein
MIFHVSHGYGERSRTSFFNTIIKTTNKCGNKLYHENDAPGAAREPRFRVKAYLHIYWSKSEICFYACVEEGCSASLPIAREKQT